MDILARHLEKMNTRRKGMTGKVAFAASYKCQADGMHHPDCPGRSSTWSTGVRGPSWNEFDKHHVVKRAWGGPDFLENLLWTWHRCHLNIHQNEAKAVRLGLLSKPPEGVKLIGKDSIE